MVLWDNNSDRAQPDNSSTLPGITQGHLRAFRGSWCGLEVAGQFHSWASFLAGHTGRLGTTGPIPSLCDFMAFHVVSHGGLRLQEQVFPETGRGSSEPLKAWTQKLSQYLSCYILLVRAVIASTRTWERSTLIPLMGELSKHLQSASMDPDTKSIEGYFTEIGRQNIWQFEICIHFLGCHYKIAQTRWL